VIYRHLRIMLRVLRFSCCLSHANSDVKHLERKMDILGNSLHRVCRHHLMKPAIVKCNESLVGNTTNNHDDEVIRA
jgi:hypothetical protein